MILKTPPGASYTCAKIIRTLADTDILLMIKLAAENNVQSQDFHFEIVKSVTDLKNL